VFTGRRLMHFPQAFDKYFLQFTLRRKACIRLLDFQTLHIRVKNTVFLRFYALFPRRSMHDPQAFDKCFLKLTLRSRPRQVYGVNIHCILGVKNFVFLGYFSRIPQTFDACSSRV
jgi:hypothetical protein